MKNETSFKDIEAQCVDCGQTFTITAGEQRFFLEKGLALPKRCKPCREKRRKDKQQKDGQFYAEQNRLKWEQDERELSAMLLTLPYKKVDLNTITISNPSKELVIIGNGFDIMHGAHSSYRDFEKTIG